MILEGLCTCRQREQTRKFLAICSLRKSQDSCGDTRVSSTLYPLDSGVREKLCHFAWMDSSGTLRTVSILFILG
jgi:hypothetical protein